MFLTTRLATVLVALLAVQPAWAQRARTAPARPSGVDLARLAEIDTLIARAMAAKAMPGAVVVVGRGDQVLYEKAFGQQAVAIS